MLVTIDVGNTSIGLALFCGRRLVREFCWPTAPRPGAAAWKRRLLARLGAVHGPWEGVVIASVVPAVDASLLAGVRAFFRAEILRVTPDLALPVKNGYRNPRSVGADRLVAATAAVAECGAPVIVADFGTAVTVDAVSRDGVYIGGAILPGLRLAADALGRGTALLPRLEFTRPRPVKVPGRTTRDSLESGIVLGTAGAVCHLIARMRRELGPRTPVVATGGTVRWVAPYCAELRRVRPHLIHEGLRLAWEYRQSLR